MEKRFRLDTKKIKHRMIDLNVRNRDLARKMGVKRPTVSRHVYNLRFNPRIQRAIARALKVKLNDILLDGENKAA